MPVQFRQTYEGPLEQWVDLKDRDLGRGLKATDDMTGQEVPVDLTSFADDAKEINMAEDWKDGVENISRSTALLDQTLEEPDLTQNAGKAEHVPMFFGPGQDTNIKRFKQAMEHNGLGRVDKSARYLGAWPSYNGSTAEVVEKRI